MNIKDYRKNLRNNKESILILCKDGPKWVSEFYLDYDGINLLTKCWIHMDYNNFILKTQYTKDSTERFMESCIKTYHFKKSKINFLNL